MPRRRQQNYILARKKNTTFTTALHIFIALVVLDCIAESQLKTATAKLYLDHPQQPKPECPSQSAKPPPQPSRPALRRTKNPILVSRPLISSPSSPTSPLSSTFSINTESKTSQLQFQSQWRQEAQKMLAWIPLNTLEEVIEIAMEIVLEAGDVI
jgi:hypothetical protein